mgnify:CR=1 FL=1
MLKKSFLNNELKFLIANILFPPKSKNAPINWLGQILKALEGFEQKK